MKIKKLFGIIALIVIIMISCNSNLVGTNWTGKEGDSIRFISATEVEYMGFINAPYTISGKIIKITYPFLGEWTYELKGGELIVKSGDSAIIGYKFIKDK